MSKRAYVSPKVTRYESVEDLPEPIRQVVEEMKGIIAKVSEMEVRDNGANTRRQKDDRDCA